MTHDEAGVDADAGADADESEHSCITVTARRVPVSAVGRVRSGMFERPRTLLMGITSTTASMVSQGSSSLSMGEAAERERQSLAPPAELSPVYTHEAAYAQPAVARHSGLAYLGAGTGAGPAGLEKEKVEEKRRSDLQGPRFSERWSGWSPSSIGDSETRSGDGHAV